MGFGSLLSGLSNLANLAGQAGTLKDIASALGEHGGVSAKDLLAKFTAAAATHGDSFSLEKILKSVLSKDILGAQAGNEDSLIEKAGALLGGISGGGASQWLSQLTSIKEGQGSTMDGVVDLVTKTILSKFK
ncbi:MAG: hypothetical protein LBR05_07025 [Azoarcus sp.]|jgi:ribosomal protein L10|nr:hypothetical protein [Azoarcus sp.]